MPEVDINDLTLKPVDLWMNQWLLLTAGTLEDCNMMTVAWGSIGCMWGRPFAQIVVRPQRHTKSYLDPGDSFTLCAFPEDYRADLNILGTISGREFDDKLAESNLTLKPSSRVSAPGYNEAVLTLECRKIYVQDMDPDGFVDRSIDDHYPTRDYHIIYYGEILAAFEGES